LLVTVLWEDQRGGLVKGFGPDDLLRACVSDVLGPLPAAAIKSAPKKGIGNLLRDLKKDVSRLTNSGPVFVVIDRDRIKDHLPSCQSDCMQALRAAIRDGISGSYDIVFLIDNLENLVSACSLALGLGPLKHKPNPDARDRIFSKVAWGSQDHRESVKKLCPSFERLVTRVTQTLKATLRQI
jgi:hypothetical protein